MYNPSPVNTQNVALPAKLLELTEQIAENVHENWALSRIREGWVYGPQRNDAKKTTPCGMVLKVISFFSRPYAFSYATWRIRKAR